MRDQTHQKHGQDVSGWVPVCPCMGDRWTAKPLDHWTALEARPPVGQPRAQQLETTATLATSQSSEEEGSVVMVGQIGDQVGPL